MLITLTLLIIFIGVFIIIFKRKKNHINSFVKQSTFTNRASNTPKMKKANPSIDLVEVKQYLKRNPAFHNEGKKRINNRTGYPLAKQTSIDRSKKDFAEMLSWPTNNYYDEAHYDSTMAIENYLLGIELPFLKAGTIAYKQGDWDLAERWWLSVLDIRPTNVLKRLEIMYRKQQRYKDIVKLYKIAGPLTKKYDSLTHSKLYSAYTNMAILEEEPHKKDDYSIGIKSYSSKIDNNYLQLLKSAK